MNRSLYAFVFVVLAAAGGPLGAQARAQPMESRSAVPRTHMPPAGMCRIWLDNVPPSQQPAPTDCASAVRNRPRNGRVVFSEQLRENSRLPIVKQLAGPDAKKSPSDPPAGPPKADPKRIPKPPRPTDP